MGGGGGGGYWGGKSYRNVKKQIFGGGGGGGERNKVFKNGKMKVLCEFLPLHSLVSSTSNRQTPRKS